MAFIREIPTEEEEKRLSGEGVLGSGVTSTTIPDVPKSLQSNWVPSSTSSTTSGGSTSGGSNTSTGGATFGPAPFVVGPTPAAPSPAPAPAPAPTSGGAVFGPVAPAPFVIGPTPPSSGAVFGPVDPNNTPTIPLPAPAPSPPATPIPPAIAGRREPSSGSRNSSGGWTNISSYLDANKEQAAALGGTVAGTIDKETGEARTAISDAERLFADQINRNRLNYDQGALDRTLQSGNADDQVRKQLAGAYGGPLQWDEEEIQKKVDQEIADAARRAALTGDVGGRIELLRESSQNPQTTGNLKLNQLFLQSNQDAAKALQDATERTKPLGGLAQASEEQGMRDAAQAQTDAAAIGEKTRSGITSYLSQEEANRQTLLGQEQARIAQEQQAARDYLAKLSEIPADADPTQYATGGDAPMASLRSAGPTTALPPGWQAAGLTQEQAANLAWKIQEARALGIEPPKLSDYYSAEDASGLTQANVVSPEEAARITALNQLVGLGGIQSGPRVSSTGNFNVTGIGSDLDARIATQRGINAQAAETAAANERLLAQEQLQTDAANRAAQDAADAEKKAAKVGTAVSAASGAAAGFMIGGPVGAVVGGVLGAIVCFEENTPVTMEDGSLKMIKNIQMGDKLLLGGTVTGVGKYLADALVNYRGCYMTPTHVVYHEVSDGVYTWTTAGEVGIPILLGKPVVVCPLMTETHLIVTGDFVSSDISTVPPEVDPDWSMNHNERIAYLNKWDERNAQINQLIKLRKEKVEEILCSM